MAALGTATGHQRVARGAPTLARAQRRTTRIKRKAATRRRSTLRWTTMPPRRTCSRLPTIGRAHTTTQVAGGSGRRPSTSVRSPGRSRRSLSGCRCLARRRRWYRKWVVPLTCSPPLACALPPLLRHHRLLGDSRAGSSFLAVGLVCTMICGGSCGVRTRQLASRRKRWRKGLPTFWRRACLFGQPLDEVSFRLGITPSPVELQGACGWVDDSSAVSAMPRGSRPSITRVARRSPLYYKRRRVRARDARRRSRSLFVAWTANIARSTAFRAATRPPPCCAASPPSSVSARRWRRASSGC